ncbi:MAG: hypothetical protein AAF529_07990 [Pseudomonadota bacterium]
MVPYPELIVATFLVCLVAQWAVLWLVRRPEWLAQVNERSSHVQPTPTMGGVVMIGVCLVWLTWAAWLSPEFRSLGAAWAFGVGLLAVVSLLDDVRGVSVYLRLTVQAVSVLAVGWGLGLHEAWPLYLCVAGWLGALWLVNLYNFMDGIDGYAAVQCLAFCIGVQVLSLGVPGWAGSFLWILSAACLVFLGFNWPPARIFMGDVGSAPLGLLLAGLVVHLWVADIVPLVAGLILLAGFWFDATYTLCVRIRTGQRITEAHRLHLYQRLAEQKGHLWTTLALSIYFVAWLLPWAWLSMQFPTSIWIAALYIVPAVLPMLVLCIRFGAGLPVQAVRSSTDQTFTE